jgi:hypothetical protein
VHFVIVLRGFLVNMVLWHGWANRGVLVSN